MEEVIFVHHVEGLAAVDDQLALVLRLANIDLTSLLKLDQEKRQLLVVTRMRVESVLLHLIPPDDLLEADILL